MLIFIISAQHTGTWTLIRHVERSPDIDEVGMLTKTKPNVIEGYRAADKLFCFHDHLSTAYRATHMVTPYAVDVPIVVPIRDPLRAVLTRQTRRSDLEHAYIIQAFCAMAEFINKYNVMLFPVDLPVDVEVRLRQLGKLYKFLGIKAPGALKQHAAEWELHNVSYKKDWKEDKQAFDYLYKARDYEKIKRYVPTSAWVLEQVQPKLQPFMERIGYEDLMWFK
jgi:hypothetical protein